MAEDYGVPRDAYLAALKRERDGLEAAGHARRLAAVRAEIDRVDPPKDRRAAAPVEKATAPAAETAATPKPRTRKA